MLRGNVKNLVICTNIEESGWSGDLGELGVFLSPRLGHAPA